MQGQESLADGDFVVRAPLQARAIGGRLVHNGLGFETAIIRVGELADVGGQGSIEMFVEGLALPVGGYFVQAETHVLVRNAEGVGSTQVDAAQNLLVEVAVQFRIEDAVAAKAASTAGNQGIRIDIDSDLLCHILESLGPAQAEQLSFCLPHGFGEVEGTLHINAGYAELDPIADAKAALVALAVQCPCDDTFFLGSEATSRGHGIPPKGWLNVESFIDA